MVNATRMGAKLARRTPYSQPGPREKMSWFTCIDLGYCLRRVFYACGFSFPLVPSGSGSSDVSLLHTYLAVLSDFRACSRWFTHVFVPLPPSGIVSLIFFFYIHRWSRENFIFVLRVPFWWCWCFPITQLSWEVKSLVVNASHGCIIIFLRRAYIIMPCIFLYCKFLDYNYLVFNSLVHVYLFQFLYLVENYPWLFLNV